MAPMCELPALLECLSERLLAKELVAAMKEITKVATEGQVKDSIGASWAPIAAGNEVKGKETGNLLSEVESQASGGRSKVGGGAVATQRTSLSPARTVWRRPWERRR